MPLFGEVQTMNRHLAFRTSIVAGLLSGLGVLAGCATSSPDAYTAREFDIGALLVDLQAVPRASTSVITAADISALPPSYTVEEILAHTSGIYLRRDERPGGEMTVYVMGAADPLYVVDGVPIQPEGHLAVNSQDVERIELYKYGAGTALYGLRGSNGVIVITTKKR
jgi:TonB-dependent SusC/RagA subfamily outer membrane receptor